MSLEYHKAFLSALGMPYFAPTISDQRSLHDFLHELKSLDETPGGPVCPGDIGNVIRWMRAENQKGSKWALRYSKLLRDPETFRDLVLERRRIFRKPTPATQQTVQEAGDVRRTIETPVSAEPVKIDHDVTDPFLKALRARKARSEAREGGQ